jgi:hypothetical protein
MKHATHPIRSITGPDPYVSVGSESIVPCDAMEVFGTSMALIMCIPHVQRVDSWLEELVRWTAKRTIESLVVRWGCSNIPLIGF